MQATQQIHFFELLHLHLRSFKHQTIAYITLNLLLPSQLLPPTTTTSTNMRGFLSMATLALITMFSMSAIVAATPIATADAIADPVAEPVGDGSIDVSENTNPVLEARYKVVPLCPSLCTQNAQCGICKKNYCKFFYPQSYNIRGQPMIRYGTCANR